MLKVILSTALVLGFATSSLAQTVARELKGTVLQMEQSEKEAMILIDTREEMLLIKNLTKFTAGELSLLKSSLEQSTPVKIKAQGNEIIAVSK
jgi:hypothetical protein